MKILITGTTGFVGKNVKEYLLARYPGVMTPVRAELDLHDSVAVKSYIDKHNFDIIIHCAVTLASVEQNLKMYFNIERCSKMFGKMISVGSGAEYDMRNYSPMMSETRFGTEIPADIYGLSKYIIGKNIELDRKNIFNLRVFGIYGKYENYNRRFISNNICRVLANKDISLNRNAKFDYLYVSDFAKIVDDFMKKNPKHKSYNMCTGIPVDLYTLAEIIRDVDGKNAKIVVKQDGMQPEYTGDNSLYTKEFGPLPLTDHKTAISELYKWYRDESKIVFNELEFN